MDNWKALSDRLQFRHATDWGVYCPPVASGMGFPDIKWIWIDFERDDRRQILYNERKLSVSDYRIRICLSSQIRCPGAVISGKFEHSSPVCGKLDFVKGRFQSDNQNRSVRWGRCCFCAFLVFYKLQLHIGGIFLSAHNRAVNSWIADFQFS